MMKHLRELPAVVVIFFELDWTDPDWNEKKLECAGKVRPTRKYFVELHSYFILKLIFR